MGFGSKSLNYIKSLYFNEAFKYEPDIILIYSNKNSNFCMFLTKVLMLILKIKSSIIFNKYKLLSSRKYYLNL